MKANIGLVDKGIRLVIALIIAILYLTDMLPSVVAIPLLVVAVIFAITGFINFCPLYAILKIRTNKPKI